MADRFTIQRFPTGVPDLLGMKGTGDTPNMLASELRGSIDLSQYYLADRMLRGKFTTAALIAAGTTVPGAGIVPDGELWLVDSVWASTVGNLNAGERYRGRVGVHRQGNGVNGLYCFPQASEQFQDVTAQAAWSANWLPWVMLRPGDGVCIRVDDLTLGTHAFDLFWSYCRIEI